MTMSRGNYVNASVVFSSARSAPPPINHRFAMMCKRHLLAVATACAFICHFAFSQSAKYPDCYPIQENGRSKLAALLDDPDYAATWKTAVNEIVRANSASVKALRKLDAEIAEASRKVAALNNSNSEQDRRTAQEALLDLENRRREVVNYQNDVLKHGWRRATGCASPIPEQELR